jgi:N-hydroxyarylamine O-acetyltransferase
LLLIDFNLLFRDRIGFSLDEGITLEDLNIVLDKTAKNLPFENLCIMKNKPTVMTKEGLIQKIITRKEGGLCYELNTILHLFLKENGFNVSLVRGVIYDHNRREWNSIGKTHVTNLIHHNGESYIVDTGFGGNLPLKPVPLSGKTVTSDNGEFRAVHVDTIYGDYIFYMKLKHQDKDWRMGYAFDSKDAIKNENELHEIQEIILKHPDSPFNKRPLVTRLTDTGNMTLTGTSFTERIEGKLKKEEIDQNQFRDLAREKFGLESN